MGDSREPARDAIIGQGLKHEDDWLPSTARGESEDECAERLSSTLGGDKATWPVHFSRPDQPPPFFMSRTLNIVSLFYYKTNSAAFMISSKGMKNVSHLRGYMQCCQ